MLYNDRVFTGIIRHKGQVVALTKKPSGSYELTISTNYKSGRLGDSIAIQGTCLTITEAKNSTYSFQVIPESISRTALSQLTKGSEVNIEPALKLSDRLDGHFVLGHVDGTAKVLKITSTDLTFSLPKDLSRFIAPKGSITINGVSLTVTTVTKTSFSIAIIDTTKAETSLGKVKKNMLVNIEVDVIARYLNRLII